MPITRLALWFLLALLLDAADIMEDGIQAELEANQNNLTALRTITAPPWVSSASFRGTTSILWSCLVTLVACIFTAIHLNIPTETSTLRRLLQKLKWVLIALVAPEIVLYCASSQFSEARGLINELNKLEKDKNNGDESAPFDLKYGFFAVMGGLEVSIAEIYNTTKNVRLSPKGVLQLAKLGHPRHMLGAHIDDKGKANLIQKSLVMLQVTWMATQCITRRAYGLPLTLLEIHTMVHVVCALTMYIFWFYKPLDISEPQHFDSSAFDDILALMVMEQLCWREAPYIMIYPPWSPNSDQPTLAVDYAPWESPSSSFVSSAASEDNAEVPPIIQQEPQLQHQVREVDWITPDRKGCTLKLGQALKCGFGYVQRGTPEETKSGQSLVLSEKDMTLWERASNAVRRYEGLAVVSGPFRREMGAPRYPSAFFCQSFDIQSTNLPRFLLDESPWTGRVNANIILRKNPLLLALLLALPAVYGGIHLTAWDLEFPSDMERLMWKIACLDIITTMIGIVGISYVFILIKNRWFHPSNAMDLVGEIVALCMLVSLVIYALCRMFLVVESFISLRKVPIGVYWTPSWLQMIPHV